MEFVANFILKNAPLLAKCMAKKIIQMTIKKRLIYDGFLVSVPRPAVLLARAEKEMHCRYRQYCTSYIHYLVEYANAKGCMPCCTAGILMAKAWLLHLIFSAIHYRVQLYRIPITTAAVATFILDRKVFFSFYMLLCSQ